MSRKKSLKNTQNKSNSISPNGKANIVIKENLSGKENIAAKKDTSWEFEKIKKSSPVDIDNLLNDANGFLSENRENYNDLSDDYFTNMLSKNAKYTNDSEILESTQVQIQNQEQEASMMEENNQNANQPDEEKAVNRPQYNRSARRGASVGMQKSLGREILEWVYAIVVAIVITVLIKSFVFDIVKVDGDSMLNTLHNTDRLILTKMWYEPTIGDVVILDSKYKFREEYIKTLGELNVFEKLNLYFNIPTEYKKEHYVKRVIALEGQKVDINENGVFVDDKLVEEAYLEEGVQTHASDEVKMPITVPSGCIFVMGDNRENSSDSRFASLGFVPVKAVKGKAAFRIWPLSNIGMID